jgi:GPI mannosyltransferase 3
LWCGQHSLTTDYVAHPDEIFEYLEPAYRLVFGQGIVTWEYAYGTRSWIISGFIALILKCLAELGLDRPDIYVPTVRLVFCAISLSLPLSVYRIA